MLNYVCGALGLLGALVYGNFLVSEVRSSWREGRRNELRLTPGILGCLIGFTAPLLIAGLARVPGVGWWSLLAPLLRDQAAQIPDAWLFRLSELDGVHGPEQRGSRDLLDCQPVRKAARTEIARRAATK
jgi:hypothetical protein